MANLGQSKSAPGAAIRGPRRVRPTGLPPEPTVEIAPDHPTETYAPARAVSVRPSDRGASTARNLRAVTEAEVRAAQASLVDITRVGSRRGTYAKRVAWFMGGLALGALVVGFVRGDLESARAWGANMLRGPHKAPTPAMIQPASTDGAGASAPTIEPCTSTQDPCTILMAPFQDYPVTTVAPAAEVRTVSIDDLPKVKPPPPRVVWVPQAAPVAKAEAAEVVESADSVEAADTEIPLATKSGGDGAGENGSASAAGSASANPTPNANPSPTADPNPNPAPTPKPSAGK